MAGLTVSLTTAGNPYNLMKVILGTQTTGVTSSHTYKNISPNVGEVSIQNDPTSPGNVAVGDGAVTTSDFGALLLPGDSKQIGEGHRGTVPLPAIWIAVTVNATKVNLEWIT